MGNGSDQYLPRMTASSFIITKDFVVRVCSEEADMNQRQGTYVTMSLHVEKNKQCC